MREVILEHGFVAEVLRLLWARGVYTAEVLRSEFDAGGHDLVLTLGPVTRHIQMKSSRLGGRAASQVLNLRLLDRPSGCFVWLVVDDALRVDHYLFLGADAGQPLSAAPRLEKLLPDGLKIARHAKGDAKGYKAEKLQHRVLPRGLFDRCDSLDALIERLLGSAGASSPA